MEQLLFDLSKLGIKLGLDGDELRVSAPQGVLTEELRQTLRAQKDQLRYLLQKTQGAGSAAFPLPAADPARRFEPFPLTEMQHAYWVGRDSALEMGNVATHLYVEFDCRDLDVTRLEDALCRMIDRHDMLRAVVGHDGMQRILSDVPRYRIAVDDCSAASPEQAESAIAANRDALSHEVRKADQWPLFEVRATLLPASRLRLHVSLDLLILDAASIFFFFQEWHQLYQHPEIELPCFGISFRDCVLAEQARRQSEATRRAHAYWMERVDTLPASPPLPLRSDPAARHAPRFSRRESRLERVRWDGLKAVIRSKGLTPSTFLLAVYAQVLARWSATSHFTLNVTVSNRPPLHQDISRLIGDFTSLVMHEVDQRDRRLSFLDFARTLQQQFMTDLDHRQVSGVTVLREWAKRRGIALQATMPVVFSSGLTGSGDQEVGNLEQFGPKVYSVSQTSQVWLDHHVVEVNGDLVFNWDAADAVFEDGVLDAMFAAYCNVLDRLCEDASLWDSVDIVALPKEMQLRREQANLTSHDVPHRKIHAGFVEHAREHPDAVALISPERTMTYGELLAESCAVADWLIGDGVHAGQPVAVLMRKGWEQIVAVYGTLLAGGAYMPIDADLPLKRQLELLRIGEAGHVLTQPASNRIEPDSGGWKVHEIRAGASADYSAAHAKRLDAGLTDLAYVIFTSGTTGVPKGVMIDHRGAMNTIAHVNRLFGVGPQDRVLGVSSLSFDLSVYDIFGLHAAGGALVLPDHAKGHDPLHWRDLIVEHRVTLWNSAPQLMKMLMDSFYSGETETAPLRTVLLSGDFIPLDLPGRIRSRYVQAAVVSLGGATEASIWSIYYPVKEIDATWASIPYGMPLPNQTIRVCDSALRPCPDHVKGRIFIGGIGLAAGYWRDAEKTVARFITHPETGERLYDTGDLGRYAADGNVIILGRDDGQVKIRGHRVELGEIEAVLNQHAGIRQAVVLATPGPAEHRRLAAYIEPAVRELSEQTLRDYLSDRLPDYMVPRHLMLMDAMPVSANGKIDYRALPEISMDPESGGHDLVLPRNATEQTIFDAWSRVIAGCEIGVTDNFFDLGGDSILATQLVRELNAVLPAFNLEMHELFESLTIESLAALYQARVQEGGDAQCPDTAHRDEADADAMLADVQAAIEGFADIDFNRPEPDHAVSAFAPEAVLLTGATGWIGAHVLFELLSLTRAKVFCLVRRCGTPGSAVAPIEAMQRHGLGVEPSWHERVELVYGDLARPQLGMEQADWQDLAELVDAIYHLGASLNVMVDYATHRNVNVDPVVPLVQLAAEHHVKPVFFCSPMAVSRRRTETGMTVLHEERAHADPAGIPTGYAQSKWVAEQVLLAAAGRGLPVRIYRTSHALPSLRTGQIKPNDTYATVLQAACAAGVIPDWSDSAFNGIPVDIFARLLVENSLLQDGHRGIVHLENRHPLDLKSLIGILLEDSASIRGDVACVGIEEWKAHCLEAAARLPQESAGLANFLFTPRPFGSAVENMFGAHPIDTGYVERLGRASQLSDLTPAAYWRMVRRNAGW